MVMGPRHIPVLLEEAIGLLGCGPHRTYVDATLGGGGHSLEILKRTGPDGRVIGIEWDEEAVEEATRTLSPFGDRVRIFRQSFVCLPEILREMNIESVDGILFDLGLSSIQLDRQERGFSFRGGGPLDMRMDQRAGTTAADLVNELSPSELEKILREYGEERWAKRIAKAIVDERSHEPIETTQALQKIVYRTIPRRFQSRRIDPATRTFQALRIGVNRELENLREVLDGGWLFLKAGGRMCVISFHSLEDRIVKETFRRLEKGEAGGSVQKGAMKILTKKPIVPSEKEQSENPRSRSAKLRCAERM
jgi:16S rRNA (cytosine1402-N4)-methyltransferase